LPDWSTRRELPRPQSIVRPAPQSPVKIHSVESVFRILGPLEVEGIRGLGGPKPRTLLARLLLEPNRVVAYDELVDVLWPHDPPARARHALQVYVSSLRQKLGADRIRTEAGGYAVLVDADELDLARFERLADEGARRLRQRDPRGAHDRLEEALALWRGEPLADIRPALEPERARLEEARLAALEDRIDAGLALGRHARQIAELEALVARHPTRERLRRLLMLALYRSGRQADALEAYRDARRTSVDELGLEPSAELRELEAAILRQDTALDLGSGQRARVPAPATPLVGRRRELDAITALLAHDTRLVTLTGPGGAGKTRLALQAAREVAALFDDGVVFVEFAAMREPALVHAEIEAVLDRAEVGGSAGSLGERLRPLAVLIVLDNFEQLADAGPDVAGLLATAPGLKLLVTSRQPLRVYGEHEFPVEPLALDDEAVPLFLQRAAAVGRTFEPQPAIRELCLRLDCLPLAIELAAARTRDVPLDELRATLPRLEAASEGPRDVPDRQRTLAATIDWSYDLLEEGQRRLVQDLSVFVGGWDEAAASFVCGAGAGELESLVSHSLIVRRPGRFAMLETVREYAASRLDAAEHAPEVVARHRTYFLELAERGDEALAQGEETADWLERLELDHDNLRVAFDRALATGYGESALRLAVALGRFWEWRSHGQEGLDRLERALAQHDGADALRARALMRTGVFAHLRGDLALAGERLERALALARSAGDETVEANALRNLGALAKDRGEHTRARELQEEARLLSAKHDDAHGVSSSLINLADIALSQRDWESAERLAQESVALARELGHDVRELVSLINVGLACVNRGRVEDARAAFAPAVQLSDTLRYPECLLACLEGLAAIDVDTDEPVRAARFLGASDSLRETTGYTLERAEQELHERTLAAARTQLGPGGFDAAWRQGRALTFEDAAEHALAAARTGA
jgi:predicted ATPase/DNA-binding SARP family transcriptional activator